MDINDILVLIDGKEEDTSPKADDISLTEQVESFERYNPLKIIEE